MRGLFRCLGVGVLGMGIAGGVFGCRSFRPKEILMTRDEDGNVTLDTRYLKKKQTVEVKGKFHGTDFEASGIEVEDPDDEIEVKSVLREMTAEGGTVGGVSFTFDERSRFVRVDGERVTSAEISEGSWVKAECKETEEGLVLRKLGVRERKPDEQEEIQGEIAKLERGQGRFFLGETVVDYEPQTPVLWTLEEPPPDPSLGGHGVSQIFWTSKGVRKIQRIDEDDRRPDEQLTFGSFLTVGGEVQYDLEWRDNHDLNDERSRDRLVHGIGARLEFSFDFSESVFGFLQVSSGYRYVHLDQDRDLDFNNETRIREAFVLFEDLPFEGVAVQVGRQDFDHGREWVVDENLDALRFYFNLGKVLIEASWSSVLYQERPEDEDVQNLLLGVHTQPFGSQELFLYALNRREGERIDFDRTHLGVSVEGDVGPIRYWLDGAYVFGKEDETRVEGYGIDQSVMYVHTGADLEPSIYFGWAMGSGDDNPEGGQDHTFRQTGLNDNNTRFNGVTSFRYLGELVRPDLENIAVTTMGVGLKSENRNSIDFVFHRYRQVERAPFLGESRLRRRPEGDSKDLGNSLDLILGIEKWRPLEIEVVLGHFWPGSAFPSSSDPAWFGTVQVEWNF